MAALTMTRPPPPPPPQHTHRNRDACLSRAHAWHAYCRNPSALPFTATFVATGESRAFPPAAEAAAAAEAVSAAEAEAVAAVA